MKWTLTFHLEGEAKAQLLVVSETMPTSVRKMIKKYLAEDPSMIDFTKETAAEENDDDDDDDEEVKLDDASFVRNAFAHRHSTSRRNQQSPKTMQTFRFSLSRK